MGLSFVYGVQKGLFSLWAFLIKEYKIYLFSMRLNILGFLSETMLEEYLIDGIQKLSFWPFIFRHG